MLAVPQRHVARAGVGQFLFVPGVDDAFAVHVDAHAVVATGVKAVRAGGEAQGARPADGKVVGRDFRGGAAAPPVKVDRRVVAHQDRRAGQVVVVKVFPAPRSAAREPFPGHLDGSRATVLIVLDAHAVGAPGDKKVHGGPGGLAVAPVVDDLDVAHPDADPVVAAVGEAIGAGLEPLVAGPTGGKVVGGDARAGAAVAPFKVQGVLVAGDGWRAGQVAVGKVLGVPGAPRVGRHCGRSQGHTGYQEGQ